MQIIYDATRVRETFVIYRLEIMIDGIFQPVMISADTLPNVLKLREPMKRPIVQRLIAANHMVQVSMLATRATLSIALAEAHEMGRAAGLPGNLPDPLAKTGKTVPITDSSGNEYETIRQAAAELGVHPQSITNHLQGRPGYATVKGLTFKRIDNRA